MDIVLEGFDRYFFDHVFASLFPRDSAQLASQFGANSTLSTLAAQDTAPFDVYQYKPASVFLQFPPTETTHATTVPPDNAWRQLFELFTITWIFGLVVYYLCASLSYCLIFDKSTFNHPKYLKNQIRMEIAQTNRSLPGMSILTAPFFLAEVRGYSWIYDATEDGPGVWYNLLQIPLFLIFTDACIYWIHRGLHSKLLYKRLHKSHHKWIMPTPYASHAFHPLDGFAQSLPYHIFPFLFPLQKFAYIGLFAFINIWTVMIHDGEYYAKSAVINGAACHTLHHLYFNYNYGQYTTLWDRLGGSYRRPNDELFQKDLKMGQSEWSRQAKEMEQMVKEVEGEDERAYVGTETKKAQ